MIIYYLAWTANGQIPKDNEAYTNEERAQRHADLCNEDRTRLQRLFNFRWIVKTMFLKEGRKRIYKDGIIL